MKIRQITAGITICILAFIMITIIRIRIDGEEDMPDMVWYNGEVKSIEDELEGGGAREAIQKERSCLILFLTDADYQSRLNEYIVSDAMILDLYIKNDSDIALGEDVFAGKVIWQTKRDRYEELR